MNSVFLSFLYFIFCGAAGVIIYWRMRSIVESKGSTLNYWFPYIDLFERFYWIMKAERNKSVKAQYRLIFLTNILFVPLFITGTLILMVFI